MVWANKGREEDGIGKMEGLSFYRFKIVRWVGSHFVKVRVFGIILGLKFYFGARRLQLELN